MSDIIAEETRQKFQAVAERLTSGIMKNAMPSVALKVQDIGADTYKAAITLKGNLGRFTLSYADPKSSGNQGGYTVSIRKPVPSGQKKLYTERAEAVPDPTAKWEYREDNGPPYLEIHRKLTAPSKISPQNELDMLFQCAKQVWTFYLELTDPETVERRKNPVLRETLNTLIKRAVDLAAKSEAAVGPANGGCLSDPAADTLAVEYRSEEDAARPALVLLWRDGYFHAHARASRSGHGKDACDALAAAFLKDQWEIEAENDPNTESFSFYTKSAMSREEAQNAQPEPLARKIAELCSRTAEFAKLLAENPDLTVDTIPIPAKFQPFEEFCRGIHQRLKDGAISSLIDLPEPESLAMKWFSTYTLEINMPLKEQVFLLSIRFTIINGAIDWVLYGKSFGTAPQSVAELWKSFGKPGGIDKIETTEGTVTIVRRYRPEGASDVNAILKRLSPDEALPFLADFYGDFLACVKTLEANALNAEPQNDASGEEKAQGARKSGTNLALESQVPVNGETRRVCGACLAPFKKFVARLRENLKSSAPLDALLMDNNLEPSLADNCLSTRIGLRDTNLRLWIRYNPAEERVSAGWQGDIHEGMAGMCRWRLRKQKNTEFDISPDESWVVIYKKMNLSPNDLENAEAAPLGNSLKGCYDQATLLLKELERQRSS